MGKWLSNNGDIELNADATELTCTWNLIPECTIYSMCIVANQK